MVSCENLGNVTVLDLGCISQLLSLDPLSGKAEWETLLFLVKIIWKTNLVIPHETLKYVKRF